ncbi:phosphate ABC transporter substrate-binding protein PstS [Rhizomonospora bruguierae]|uniref:phosphate ABC transporter substrate-binding protein PstS n=1 Tax=Rhizomonospora bruguierae TaxID=1581705 RepID=UPI0020C043E1|nr:phosphate ABC transporter substrate-binding protein PstS [Micromonospora sp. NBRC 107566]
MCRQWTREHRGGVPGRSVVRGLAASLALLVAVLSAPAPALAAPQLVKISGAGSTWSSNAIDNWRRNIQQRKIYVSYAATGSSDGRTQFTNGTVDFGVSEIPYGFQDRFAGPDPRPPRSFAYMPIVAGGTAFMYNLKIGGRQVTNLRLSGEVLTKIFTGVVKRWDDPAIKADNPGLVMPGRRIVPVVRQDGSGTSAQLTLWMSKQHPGLWDAYCAKFGKAAPCGVTSNYPYRSQDGFVGQSGSTGVAGYVGQSNAEGAITYVEYSYAINQRFPVVKVLNAGGYYVEPTAKNVAVALTRAQINQDRNSPDYLTQVLDEVYRFTDSRTYPLSSYSYMIIPTAAELNITEDKGYTLARFANYFLCEGQQQADVLGYSPLPKNLVEAGMAQVQKIPGAPKADIVIANCNNPTFSRDGTNTLAKTAPKPSECDRKGSRQSSAGTGGATQATPVAAAARCAGEPAAGGPTGSNTAGGTGNGGTAAAPSAGAVVDPDTGQVIGPDGSAAGGDDGAGGGGGEAVAAVPVSLAGTGGWQLRHTIMVIAAVLLLALVLGPPLLAQSLRRRRGGNGWEAS